METTSISTKYAQSVFQAQIDKSTVESTREITFVIAAEDTGRNHRNKFLYNWDNWKLDQFNSNPIVGYQHNVYGDNLCSAPNPDDVIAKATAWVDNFNGKRSLMSKATFEPPELNTIAEKVFRKILNGTLNSASVGVMPTGKIESEIVKNEKNETVDKFYRFPGQELLEWSVVNIPADPAALRRSMRNHTMSALSYIQRLSDDLSISNIKDMRIQEVLDLIEGRYKSAPVEQIEKELSAPDASLDKYKSKLNRFKNGCIKSKA